jgi:hypothetical protein
MLSVWLSVTQESDNAMEGGALFSNRSVSSRRSIKENKWEADLQ